MLQPDDIYTFFMDRLTEIILDEGLSDPKEIRERLQSITKTAELMHCYIGFREENRERQRQGLALLRAEEEFFGRDLEAVKMLARQEE